MARSTRARRTDPSTSHEAAERLTSDKLTAKQSLVLGMFRIHGPMYDAQLVERVHDMQKSMGVPEDNLMSPSGVRSRRAEMSSPNMDRLDEIAKAAHHMAPLLSAATFAELSPDQQEFARGVLRREGFRSPLWDSGRRVKVKGSNVIVWEVAV